MILSAFRAVTVLCYPSYRPFVKTLLSRAWNSNDNEDMYIENV